MINVELYNVILLGISFHFSSGGYITCFNAQKYFVDALRLEDPSYAVDAHIGFCVQYGSHAIANIGASVFINHFGPRTALTVGSLLNIVYIVQFLYPVAWMFYFGSVLSGVTGALMWTAQGNFLTRNSTKETIGRNTGILWALIQSGFITGNLYLLFTIQNNTFNKTDRQWFFGFLTGMLITASLITFLYRKSVYNLESSLSVGQKFIREMQLFIKKDILLLSVSFLYNGLEFSFFSGVYSSAIGQNNHLKELTDTTRVSISGILIGCGEVVAGSIFGLLGKKTILWGRFLIIITGCVIHIIVYILILLTFPNSITRGRKTDASTIIQSNLILAFICSFALGFADACYVTQIYGVLGSMFASEGPSTFAIFRFISAIGAMIAHGYTPIGLYGVLSILITVNILAAICFCIVELRPTYKPQIYDNKK